MVSTARGLAQRSRVRERLVRGYVFDALEVGQATNGAAAELAHALLAEIATAERRPLPTVGRGEYRSLAGALVGGELHVDGRVVHVSAFPA